MKYRATIEWARDRTDFEDGERSKLHVWRFDNGLSIPATSAPLSTIPLSIQAGHINPEEAFVAAVSSSHMLCFLKLAAMFGYIVEQYTDMAEGGLSNNSAGSPWVGRVVLQPAVYFTGPKVPTDEAVLALHNAAHAECPLANSVCLVIETEGVWRHQPSIGTD
jgi:organic hydroperoxide reductase OsmC/OhrA